MSSLRLTRSRTKHNLRQESVNELGVQLHLIDRQQLFIMQALPHMTTTAIHIAAQQNNVTKLLHNYFGQHKLPWSDEMWREVAEGINTRLAIITEIIRFDTYRQCSGWIVWPEPEPIAIALYISLKSAVLLPNSMTRKTSVWQHLHVGLQKTNINNLAERSVWLEQITHCQRASTIHSA